MMKKKVLILSGVLSGGLLLSGAASAADLATVSRFFGGENDCAGYFNPTGTTGFNACTIFVNDEGKEIELSPVIAKFDYDESGIVTKTETNTLFPSVTGSEFSVTLNNNNGGGNNTGGEWSYTPGEGDPGVRYWVAKAGGGGASGGGFNLFWTVDAATAMGIGVCNDVNGDIYSLACLNEAKVVTTGSFGNPEDKNLSHVTFYDTKEVPLPAAVWLFGSALLGFAGLSRRKS